MVYIFLILFTFLAWLIHVSLFSLYRKKFESTKEVLFRLIHASEIFLVTVVAMAFYSSIIDSPPQFFIALSVVLGTLLFLDVAVLLLNKDMRKLFDVYHFLAAYALVSLTVYIFFAR